MDRAALLATFAGFPDRLARVVDAATAAGEPAAKAGEWGPRENVRHLIAVEHEVWQSRLASVAAEDDPHWSWTEPGLAAGFDDARLESIVADFTAARAATVASIRALDDAGWARHGTHATYGVLDVAGLLRLAIDHDESHLAAVTRR